ncbi:MAG: hypothetical protein GWP19_09615 [Planctomycetia bacterium]|nr:hypothetical protein [Planctomycetia bacterium]
MKKVYSRQEARSWFLENHSGSVTCISVIDREEITADNFPAADKFYKKNALLNEFRSIKSISKKELAELHRKCNELGIPIGDVGPDVMKKVAIDEKNAIPHAGEPMDKDEQIRKINNDFNDILNGSVPEGGFVVNLALPLWDLGKCKDLDEISILKLMIVGYHTALSDERSKIDNLPENEQNAIVGREIHELLNTINAANKIDCTCDKARIKHSYPCICVRGGAIQQATIELGVYLKKIRQGLK